MPPTPPRWRFPRMAPSQVNQNPVQGEFFTATAGMAERLVRESIQNSLDARHGDEVVRLRFAFSGERNILPPGAAKSWLRGLEPHLEALADARTSPTSNDGDDQKETEAVFAAWELLRQPMRHLVIEDFGTTGLRGNPCANGVNERGNDFWGFFRSVGISTKSGDEAGSWGLGKWVFPDVSRVNAYFGLTRRRGESESLLMGMAMLRTHTTKDGKYPPYGFFAVDADAGDETWLPLPIAGNASETAFTEQFRRDFRLERTDEPGLSVVIPHPADDLKAEHIAAAVITQYFLPIVRGDLVVEIAHPDGHTSKINAASIEEEAARATAESEFAETPESTRRVIRLAKWAARSPEPTRIDFPITKQKERIDALDVTVLRNRFERGDPLTFRFTMQVAARGGPRREAGFNVFLEKADDMSEGSTYFVRGHLRIPRMNALQRFKACALVTVDGDTDLGRLLRDAEGPAHTSWNPHAKRLKERWSGGYQRVQALRRAPELLLQRLVEREQKPQYDALADLFPAEPDRQGGGKRQRGPGRLRPSTVPDIKSAPPPVDITRSQGGFSARASAASSDRLADRTWELRFAYDVARGGSAKAFRLFEQGARNGNPDFSLHHDEAAETSLRIQSSECEAHVAAANVLRFRPRSRGFQIGISGFDHRDLIVEVKPVDAQAEGDSQ